MLDHSGFAMDYVVHRYLPTSLDRTDTAILLDALARNTYVRDEETDP
jgi:hypothetical protein